MKNILTKKINLNFYEFLIFIFPLVVTLRSFILNLYLVIISLITLLLIRKKRVIKRAIKRAIKSLARTTNKRKTMNRTPLPNHQSFDPSA
jgi:hypothetical protein